MRWFETCISGVFKLSTVGVRHGGYGARGRYLHRHDVPDVAVSPNRRSCSDTYGGGAALYYEGDISDSDCGSVQDRERDTWEDWCDSAFRNEYGTFPPDMDEMLPTVVLSDKLFSDEDMADMPVSENEEIPVSALQVFADEGVPLAPLI